MNRKRHEPSKFAAHRRNRVHIRQALTTIIGNSLVTAMLLLSELGLRSLARTSEALGDAVIYAWIIRTLSWAVYAAVALFAVSATLIVAQTVSAGIARFSKKNTPA